MCRYYLNKLKIFVFFASYKMEYQTKTPNLKFLFTKCVLILNTKKIIKIILMQHSTICLALPK